LSSALKYFEDMVLAGAQPAEAGTPYLTSGLAMTSNLDGRIIPLLAVIANGILPPNPFSFFAAHLVKIFRCAAPSPLGPQPHVAMMCGVVMNIVNGREEVALGTHKPLSGAMEDLSSARVFLTVPSIARTSVQRPSSYSSLRILGVSTRAW